MHTSNHIHVALRSGSCKGKNNQFFWNWKLQGQVSLYPLSLFHFHIKKIKIKSESHWRDENNEKQEELATVSMEYRTAGYSIEQHEDWRQRRQNEHTEERLWQFHMCNVLWISRSWKDLSCQERDSHSRHYPAKAFPGRSHRSGKHSRQTQPAEPLYSRSKCPSRANALKLKPSFLYICLPPTDF